MELLDRYLQAVRFWLPKAQQKDIIAARMQTWQLMRKLRQQTSSGCGALLLKLL